MTESTITCERCSASVPAGSSTCPNCGAPMSEAAATGYETTKIGDVFATTKLEMPPDEPVQETTAEEPATPEPTPEPARARSEPTVAIPPASAEPSYTSPEPVDVSRSEVESTKPTKKWYSNPLAWVAGLVVLFACCTCSIVFIGITMYLRGR
jgi:hypothetical protein